MYQKSIIDQIKYRLKAGNSDYYSFQTILSSQFFSKNFNIKIFKIIILIVVLFGCETWSLTLREERRLRVFENRIPRPIFEQKRDENGRGHVSTISNLIICIVDLIESGDKI